MHMGHFKVRPGQQLSHAGRVYDAGALLQLPEHVGQDVRDKVEPCDAAGHPRLPTTPVDHILQGTRPHERISLLERDREVVQQRLRDIEAAISVEQAAATPPAKGEGKGLK